MSLPNYLAKIKSSGIYRFVWDKSQVPPQEAETLRLLIGYSEKGPFNTPVYIESFKDFVSIYGNISKRLEHRGVYFHRMAEHALQAGPILALNLKPFDEEKIGYINFNASSANELTSQLSNLKPVTKVFDTSRFWTLDADLMVKNMDLDKDDSNYITIAATDVKENSCSIFVRKYVPTSYKGVTFRSWYASQSLEAPEYMEGILDTDMSNYFAEIYVFRGEFKEELYKGGPLKAYMDVNGSIKSDYVNIFGEKADALAAMSEDDNSNFINIYQGILLPYFKDANGNYISLDVKFNADNNVHKMLMKLNENILSNVENISNCVVIPSVKENLNPIYIPGYTYESMIDKNTNKSISGDALYQKCMGVINDYKGLHMALTNRVDIEYHYLVDTFDTEISGGDKFNSKAGLFALAKEKDNAFAIINFPKMSKFDNAGVNMENAVKSFIMPSDGEGASWGAYYTQLTFSDGTVKSVVPSAGLVSNLFMEKWSSRQPYYIVAGPNFGRITYPGLVGPDFNFGRTDLDVLEPMGVNAIVYVPRKGTYINSNQTAKQVPVSGLSKIHIRELVIYLQNEIENLLQSYQWELNTQTLRDTIRSKADAICDTIKNNGGIYAFVNVCDETNNTPEVIDNEMIILDTEIEPARGAGKMVHQLTIHRTGGLTSTVK